VRNSTEANRIKMLNELERQINFNEAYGNIQTARYCEYAFKQLLDHDNADYFKMLMLANRIPPTIDEFIDNDEYLGGRLNFWEEVRKDIAISCPHIMSGVPMPAIDINNSTLGTGKSYCVVTKALFILTTLCCFNTPHFIYKGLDSNFPMLIYLISAKPSITETQIYKPIYQLFKEIPFFKETVTYKKEKTTSIQLSNNIELMMAHSLEPSALLSLAIVYGVIDEANFFDVVEESRRADHGERRFNHADKLFDTMRKRYESRFITDSLSFGGIDLCSSPNYEEDFIEGVHNSLKATKSNLVWRYRRKTKWEVAPKNLFTTGTFRFQCGSKTVEPKILEDDEDGVKDSIVVDIPNEYRLSFETNPLTAQRDHAGITTAGSSSYLTLPSRLYECIDYTLPKLSEVDNYVVQVYTEGGHHYPVICGEIPNKQLPRYFHTDLSHTGDRTAQAMAHVSGVKGVGGEMKPIITVDYVYSIEPSQVYPVDISKPRKLITKLKRDQGLTIGKVTYDSYQSLESLTILRGEGIIAETLSVDRDPVHYQNLRTAIYEGRVRLPYNEILLKELTQLVELTAGSKVKIDHLPSGSKDLADAVCGAVSNALQSREAMMILANPFAKARMEENADYEDYEDDDFEEDGEFV